MPRRDCRKDANHDDVAGAFRQLGWQVLETYQVAQYLPGWSDLVVCKANVVVFVEVKAPGAQLTEDEDRFRQVLDAYYVVCRGLADVVALDEWWRTLPWLPSEVA
jgi:hypothetical protein